MPWALTAALSPRPSVRVAAVDAHGEVLNEYTGHRRVNAPAPDRPWAVYLAGQDSRFRLLAFDLDAKTAGAAGAAERDAAVIVALATDVGLSPVVCESGPSGGRHVWVALAEPVDAQTVGTLARLTRHLCPTLDLAPLTNPATGCVRPPGAPHRSGGHSTILGGDVAALTRPTGTVDQVRHLVERLAQLVDDAEPAATLDPRRPLPVDEHARLYLPGPRRPLPAISAAALSEDAASGDASAILWRVLIGAAAAHWRHADVAALADTAPGLEHVRTSNDRGRRVPRPPRGPSSPAAVLRRQWDKAVKFVASTERQIGTDPTFDARADAITAHVRAIQTRADATPGRWTRGGGPTDRRVLDVLSILALQALSASLEADTRRLGLLAGIGRETARIALLRLAQDGWIAPARAADGPHGAHWTIDPHGLIHRVEATGRSQADPRPAGAGAAERTALLTTLTARAADAAHDLFTLGPGLGHLAGNAYARTSTTPQDVDQVARALGASPALAGRMLDRLSEAGVLTHDRHGWRRPANDRRAAAAAHRGVDGRLADRARRYLVERELWAWWRAEEAWMRAPRRPSPSRRPGRGQLSLLPDDGTHAYGPYPRGRDGRADHRRARHAVIEERAGHAARRRPDTAPITVAAAVVA